MRTASISPEPIRAMPELRIIPGRFQSSPAHLLHTRLEPWCPRSFLQELLWHLPY